MVRNIEAALGGAAPAQSIKESAKKEAAKKEEGRKLRAGGKVARVVEGIR
jgi:hypothetical protein